jgi:excisionase family DNA binding protein
MTIIAERRLNMMEESLNLEDVAKILKVSKRTVQREVYLGKLAAFRVGKSLRFRAESVQRYMEEQSVKPGEDIEDLEDVA